MTKYLVETFYTCTFKIVHKLDELNEKKLSELENTFGGGLKLRIQGLNTVKIDYCFKNIGILGNIHLYTIGIDF